MQFVITTALRRPLTVMVVVLAIVLGKIERRPVELGLRSGPLVEVRNGLDENTPVVTKQPEALRNCQEVRSAAGS